MAEKSKKNFLLHLDYFETFKLLTDEQAGKLIKIMFQYFIDGVNPIIEDQMIKMAFCMIKNRMDYYKEKWENTCQRRAEAGKKGGEAKASKRYQTVANVANATNCYQTVANCSKAKQTVANVANATNCYQTVANCSKAKQTVANVADTDTESESDTDTESESESDTDTESESDNIINDINIIIKEKNNKKKKDDFEKDQEWLESLAMKYHISIEDIKVRLAEFDNHLISIGTEHSTERNYKYHFNNWINSGQRYERLEQRYNTNAQSTYDQRESDVKQLVASKLSISRSADDCAEVPF